MPSHLLPSEFSTTTSCRSQIIWPLTRNTPHRHSWCTTSTCHPISIPHHFPSALPIIHSDTTWVKSDLIHCTLRTTGPDCKKAMHPTRYSRQPFSKATNSRFTAAACPLTPHHCQVPKAATEEKAEDMNSIHPVRTSYPGAESGRETKRLTAT